MRKKKGFGRCPYCEAVFKFHSKLGVRQITCGKDECRKKHKAKYQRNYRKLNKIETQEYENKRKINRDKDYWKNWRNRHPDYVIRNRKQSLLRKKLKKQGLQRKLDVLEVVVIKGVFDSFFEFATKERSLIKDSYARVAA